MSRSLFDYARLFAKHLFGTSTIRQRQPVRTRLTLESLEERTLLSASGTEPIVQPPLMEAGHYAIQEAMSYVSSYESTVATAMQMAANLEQQALVAISRVESAVDRMLEQLVQHTLFPTATESSPSGKSSTMTPGQFKWQNLVEQTSSEGPITVQRAVPGNANSLSLESASGQPVGTNKERTSQSSATNSFAVQPFTTTSGTWNKLTNAAPDVDGIGTMMLLSNGDVMAQGGAGSGLYPSTAWYQLTPDATGSYINGTWSNLASMSIARTFFASNVLPNGNVFVQGGEYSSAGSLTNTGETYNPVTNVWTTNAASPGYDNLGNNFGDDPSEVLPNGNVLAGYIWGPQTSIYDPTTNTWSQGPTKLNNDRSDEETWVKLPNGDFLSYSIYASVNSGSSQAQFYNPNTNTWSATGSVPVQLSSSPEYELGPALLLPDGRVFQLGANGNTAFYTPSSNSWAAGPVIPNGLVAADVPGAMLPNGDVLFAASQSSDSNPTEIFEFNPTTNVYTNVTPSDSNLNTNYNFQTRMLMLPTGQVLFSDGSDDLWVYTPSGSASSSWQPTISGVTNNGDGTFTLTGTRLNGISEGACYGDDAEMASNYPIVQLTASNGDVYYARTYNWSSTGVSAAGDTTSETVNFTLPSNLPQGTYQLSVAANGIASTAVSFNVNSYWTTVGLSSYYNRYGLTWGGKPITDGGIDGNNDALEGYYSFGWQGTTIPLVPPGNEDVVAAQGQTINSVQAGQYSTLTLFATAVNSGDQTNQKFTVNYSTGPSQTFTRSFTNWLVLPGGYSDEIRVKPTDAFNPDGTVKGTAYFSAYALPLDPSRTVTSITLPNDSNIVILATELA